MSGKVLHSKFIIMSDYNCYIIYWLPQGQTSTMLGKVSTYVFGNAQYLWHTSSLEQQVISSTCTCLAANQEITQLILFSCRKTSYLHLQNSVIAVTNSCILTITKNSVHIMVFIFPQRGNPRVKALNSSVQISNECFYYFSFL